jgi:uncharacterized protein (TIGR02453 family)
MFRPSTIKFLKDLSRNNNKAWFDSNRDRYLDAKQDFEKFVSQLVKESGKFDDDLKELQVKDCVFRINRDIRFSKNKTPYKTNLAASLDKGGKKSIYAGYYFHLEPGKSFVAGGIWMPMAPELKKIRQEIDYCLDEFVGIVNNKSFKKEFGELEATPDIALTNLPRGYEKTNPAAPFLKLKSYIVSMPIADSELTKPGLVKSVAASFKKLTPLIKFINKALE